MYAGRCAFSRIVVVKLQQHYIVNSTYQQQNGIMHAVLTLNFKTALHFTLKFTTYKLCTLVSNNNALPLWLCECAFLKCRIVALKGQLISE